MSGIVLNLLVTNINSNIRYCKERLEVEEKTKDVAFLQGKLSGYKELLNHLCGKFDLQQSFVEDVGEAEINLGEYSGVEIKQIFDESQELQQDDRWKEIIGLVETETERLKKFLLSKADNSRDLYICQAKQEGMTMFKILFSNIEDEKKRREAELDFDDEDEDSNNTMEDAESGLPPEREKLVDALENEDISERGDTEE
jgi:hypothetical protein